MFNLVDLFVLLLLLFHAVSGYRKGLFKSLLGPVSFVVCCTLAWMYFKRTHNVLISLTISLLGPIFIKLFIPWIVDLNAQGTSEPSKESAKEINRWLGGVVGLVWGMLMAFLILLFVVINPSQDGPVFGARKAVVKSLVFSATFARLSSFSPLVALTNPPESMDNVSAPVAQTDKGPAASPSAVSESALYQDLYNDPRIKDLLADPQIKELIEQKQYMQLLQNPRFAKILDDPSLIARMIELQSKINKQK